MKKINVIVREKTILELAEDANKGDIIDLKELVQVDTSYLDSIIESGKDKVYESKLNDARKAMLAENELKLQKLYEEINILKEKHASELKIQESNVAKEYQEIINDLNDKINNLNNDKKIELEKLNNTKNNEISALNNKITVIESNKKSELESLLSKNNAEIEKIKNESNSKYVELEQKYNILMSEYETKLKQSKLELENEYAKKLNDVENKLKIENALKDSEIKELKMVLEAEKAKELNDQKEKYNEELKAKDDIINNLKRAKASLNVKQTGEDLESWCDNEVSSYMQNGLLNCTWIKDNKVVKDDDEVKGSKADYIFKVYASKNHNDNELLASVCLDMKDENPESVNKKSNSDYYKQLDKNREKKNCKYAVLVSNLEMDKPNIIPIYKVREYDDMYVVRPAYLMTFLNMIASLTTRFSELILSKEVEMISLKTKLDLLQEFEDIKNTYLNKPLESLEKSIEEINKNSEGIKKACKNIDEQCDKISRSYLNAINEKINKFELKLERSIVKKLDE